jgi:hypothetical protein|tara:strand:+ start:201 stop:1964 length:1764 start_codon:yes stop_codon:yes gene_type:complete
MATQTIDYNINVNAGGSLRTIQDIENELNELNQEIKDVGVGSKAFEKAAGNIQKLEKELRNSQSAVEGFTLDKKLEAADGAIKIVAGSVAGLTGALGLLGIENENFDKLTAQATNAIAFSMGIKDISEGIGKLVKNIKLQDIATKAMAITQRIFNAIMSANPVAIVILSITTLIGLVLALKDKFELVNKVFQFFKGLVTAVGEALGLTASAEEKALAASRAASEQRILDIDNEIKIRKAAGEETVELEREKYRRLAELAEAGSQEQKDILADQAAFEAGLIKAKEDEAQRVAEEASKKRIAAAEKKKAEDEAAAIKAGEDETARLQSIQDIKDEFLMMIEERDQETELEKAELEEERKIAELELLGEDLEAVQAVRDYYAGVKEEAGQTDKANAKVIADQEADDAIAAKMAEIDGKEALEMEYINLVGSFSNLLGAIAGENKELQIAGIIVSQAANIAKIISNTTAANARALIELGPIAGAAAGVRQTISAGIGIATSVAAGAKAISQIKSASSGGGGGGGGGVPRMSSQGGGGGGAPTTTSANIDIGTNPETSVDNTAVQAYVVSGDITSTQEAEAKLSTRRAIGG